MRAGRRFGWLSLWAGVLACTEKVTAPGECPDFCPGGSLTVLDTVLRTAIGRDSAFRGFILAHEAPDLLAADLPAVVDSRPIFRLQPISSRARIGTDTTTGPVRGVDSLRLSIVITRRDTAASNLTLRLYLLPLTIDSATTFADLAAPFAGAPVRTVNVHSLLARPGKKDPVTGDSVVVDTLRRVTVLVKLDSAQAPYVPADSGALAFGIRVAADSLASIALGGGGGALTPTLTWFFKVDSLGRVVHRGQNPLVTTFSSFVFDPPPPPLDLNLAVGGVPAARSILRVSLPRFIRDSTVIVRGTLILVPAVAARGAPADSFSLTAQAVVADFGAKSPLTPDLLRRDSAEVRVGSTDTVRIELTGLLRIWSLDTLAPTAIMLRQTREGGSLGEIRFYPSANAAFRPALQVTYMPRFRLGIP